MLEKPAIGAGALVDLMSDFYGASMDGRFWPTALAKLRDALDAGMCALASHDFSAATGTLEQVVGLPPEAVRAYEGRYARTNIWLQREDRFRTPGQVWTGSDLVDEAAAAASEFVRGWLAPAKLEHQMFGILDRQATRVLFIYVARPADAPAFGEEESSLLRRLLPYLQRGLRAGQVLKRTQNVREVALDALDAMPIGVVVVSAAGMVLSANRTARDVMAARDVLSLGRNGLEVVKDGRSVRIRDLIADAEGVAKTNGPKRGIAFPVIGPERIRPVTLLICPIRDNDRMRTGEQPAAVLFVGDADRDTEIDESRLRLLYGLTKAEARVTALLARGQRLDEISETLGVAYETTRKHLKQIFAKTSTSRQADLVRIVMTGPAGLAL